MTAAAVVSNKANSSAQDDEEEPVELSEAYVHSLASLGLERLQDEPGRLHAEAVAVDEVRRLRCEGNTAAVPVPVFVWKDAALGPKVRYYCMHSSIRGTPVSPLGRMLRSISFALSRTFEPLAPLVDTQEGCGLVSADQIKMRCRHQPPCMCILQYTAVSPLLSLHSVPLSSRFFVAADFEVYTKKQYSA